MQQLFRLGGECGLMESNVKIEYCFTTQNTSSVQLLVTLDKQEMPLSGWGSWGGGKEGEVIALLALL